MTSHLAAIEVMKFPWIAFLFVLAYWKTAVAAIWGVGFVAILTKRMREWYREDGRDAAIGVSSEEAIYSRMKMLARERRGARIKGLLTNGLFWILYWAHSAGKRLAKWVFYPILALLDKAQTSGIEEGRNPGLRRLPVTNDEEVAPNPESSVLIEGENASKCIGCGVVVAHGREREHACKRPLVIVDHKPAKAAVHKCDGCERMVKEDVPHRCKGRAGRRDGMIHCECGAVYKDEQDFEHVCPDEPEEGEDIMAECKDCDVEYNPADDVHVARFCKGCDEVHCKKHDCGQLVS